MPTGSTTKKAVAKREGGAALKRVVAAPAPAKKVAASKDAGLSDLARILADPIQRTEVANAIELQDMMAALVAAREIRGWSQREIAEKLGVSQPVISQAEKGNTSLSVNMLQRYARAVGARLVLQFSR